MLKSFLISIRSFALLPVLSFLLPVFAQAQNAGHVAEWLESYRFSGDFSSVNMFDLAEERTDLQTTLEKSSILTLDQPTLTKLLTEAPLTLTFSIPTTYGETFSLELVKTDILAPGFSLGTLGQNAQDNLPYQPGIHYRGIIRGKTNSLATLSVFPDGVMAMVADDNGTFQLGRMEDGSENYVFYRTADLKAQSPAHCFSDDISLSTGNEPGADDRGVGCKVVQIYFECDYKLYQDKGSNTTTVTNYVTALFNQIAALYANENVGVAISQIYVWTTPDPYVSYTSTSTVLNAFRTTKGTNFTGNLAHFLTTRNLGGGIAYVDVICLKQYAFGVSAITTSFQNVPTYSWTVEVVTHELGHNLGSWHTQSCNWPNGPLDNCVAPEGSCAPGPAPVNGGTIMSYCHLTGYGINLNNGFGSVPGNLIRSKVLAATCLSQTGSAPTGLNTTNVTGTSATLSWGAVSGTTSYTVQYKLGTSSTWTTAPATSASSLNITGLTANSAYNWQVKTDCSNYSATANFTTTSGSGGGGGGACSAPANLAAGNITASSAALSWTASSGAANYTIQYKVNTSSTWLTAGTSATNTYALSGLTASTNYNWKVKASCSDYGSVASFSTPAPSGGGGGGACNAPATLNNLNITATTAIISWTAVPGAANYTLQIKLATGTTYFTLGTVSGTQVTISGLQPATAYHWRIKASCSDYSTSKLLTTLANFTAPPTGEMPTISTLQLELYPNPASDLLNLNYTGMITPGTQVGITDATGRICLREDLIASLQTLNVSRLPVGVYVLLILEDGKQVANARFVKGQ